jgi:hypothetical protein
MASGLIAALEDSVRFPTDLAQFGIGEFDEFTAFFPEAIQRELLMNETERHGFFKFFFHFWSMTQYRIGLLNRTQFRWSGIEPVTCNPTAVEVVWWG